MARVLGSLALAISSVHGLLFADSLLSSIPDAKCLEYHKPGEFWSYRWCHRRNVRRCSRAPRATALLQTSLRPAALPPARRR